jgi:hypothetical protein
MAGPEPHICCLMNALEAGKQKGRPVPTSLRRLLEARRKSRSSSHCCPSTRPSSKGSGLGFQHYWVCSFRRQSVDCLALTWGAINEWTTQAGYARLTERANHATLRELLKRIMKQEGGHIDFYASEASRRLGESPRAQKLTRFALKHLWRPVGSGVMPKEEVGFLVNYLFDGPVGADVAARIDRRVDRLPGQEHLHLLENAVSRPFRHQSAV